MANNYRNGATNMLASFDVGATGTQNELHVPYVRNGFNATFLTESTATLGSGATFTGTGRDLTALGTFGISSGGTNIAVASGSTIGDAYEIYGFFLADQAGTGYVEQSTDGSAWFITGTAAIVANTPLFIYCPQVARYARVRQVNGATLQTSNRVHIGWRR